MSVSFARPDGTQLVFQVFSRSLHPELFVTYAQTELRHAEFAASAQINEAGHVITFRHKGHVLTEVATTRESPLPQRKRLINHRLRGHRSESVVCEGGVQYHVSFQLEQVDPEEFVERHHELLADSKASPVAHRFGSPNRMYPMPLSFLQIEQHARSLFVHAFHTFPENCAVVKIQSLFEV